MMKKRARGLIRNNQSGDTIVEVVIAIAIIATVLVGAFAVSNRSQTATRDSEEHSEALQFLQGQIKLLRAASQAGFFSGNNLTAASVFCLSTNSSGVVYNKTTLANPSSSCQQNVPNEQSGLFDLAIVCQPASPCPASGGTTTFDSTATWAALRGGTNQVQLAYKVQVEWKLNIKRQKRLLISD